MSLPLDSCKGREMLSKYTVTVLIALQIKEKPPPATLNPFAHVFCKNSAIFISLQLNSNIAELSAKMPTKIVDG